MLKSYAIIVRALWLLSGISIISCTSVLAVELSPDNLNDELSLPPGFSIEQIAEVNNARAMAFGSDGTLFVSTMIPGNIYAVKGAMGDDPQVLVLAKKLKLPTGVAFHEGDLYVADTSRVLRYKNIESRLDSPGEPEVIADDIPGGKLHGWKYIAFGPDGLLYVTVGAPCNACNEPGTALILRMAADGTGREVFARGIRNTVGFDWHPQTEVLWFTENGRDGLGDEIPDDELNSAPEAGLDFGFPYCHGVDVVEPDDKLANLGSCATARAPALALGAHVAPLGMVFYTGSMFPDEYRQQVFIAQHGSWNRSEKTGYRISLVRFENPETPVSHEIFAGGWLTDGEVRGRPADVIMAPDGSLLVTDDRRGAIYRISYSAAE
jgi:glucose/arabinose dehydrogenase